MSALSEKIRNDLNRRYGNFDEITYQAPMPQKDDWGAVGNTASKVGGVATSTLGDMLTGIGALAKGNLPLEDVPLGIGNGIANGLINNGQYLTNVGSDIVNRHTVGEDAGRWDNTSLLDRITDADYWTSQNGIFNDAAILAGSALPTLPFAFATGGLGAGAGIARLATGLLGRMGAKAGANVVGNALTRAAASKGLQEAVGGAVNWGLSSPITTALPNAGGIYQELKEQGLSDAEIGSRMGSMMLEELPQDFLTGMASGAILSGSLGKLVGKNPGRLRQFAQNAVAGGVISPVTEYYDEANQQRIQNKYTGKEYGENIFNLTQDEQAAGATAAAPALFMGLLGGARSAFRNRKNKSTDVDTENPIAGGTAAEAQSEIQQGVIDALANADDEVMAELPRYGNTPLVTQQGYNNPFSLNQTGTDEVLSSAEPFMGKRMDNGQNGCVEAVTKIGASTSQFLNDELSKGVVYVPTLVEDARKAGVTVEGFSPDRVQAGDLIVYGDDDHVVMADGNDGYVGNSTSQQKVVHGSDYNAMDDLKPTKIIKTGVENSNNHGIMGSYSGDRNIDSAIMQAAQKYNVDPALLAAVAQQESNFNQSAGSEAGARGIMQLMPATAEGLGVNPDDMQQNIEGGAKYLRQMLDQFNGDVELALAAYNAGPGAVQQMSGDISALPRETQNYVPSVIEKYENFKGNKAVHADFGIQKDNFSKLLGGEDIGDSELARRLKANIDNQSFIDFNGLNKQQYPMTENEALQRYIDKNRDSLMHAISENSTGNSNGTTSPMDVFMEAMTANSKGELDKAKALENAMQTLGIAIPKNDGSVVGAEYPTENSINIADAIKEAKAHNAKIRKEIKARREQLKAQKIADNALSANSNARGENTIANNGVREYNAFAFGVPNLKELEKQHQETARQDAENTRIIRSLDNAIQGKTNGTFAPTDNSVPNIGMLKSELEEKQREIAKLNAENTRIIRSLDNAVQGKNNGAFTPVDDSMPNIRTIKDELAENQKELAKLNAEYQKIYDSININQNQSRGQKPQKQVKVPDMKALYNSLLQSGNENSDTYQGTNNSQSNTDSYISDIVKSMLGGSNNVKSNSTSKNGGSKTETAQGINTANQVQHTEPQQAQKGQEVIQPAEKEKYLATKRSDIASRPSGTTTNVYASTNSTPTKARYKIVEADDLTTSNKVGVGAPTNPYYPQNLQPRDRKRVGMQDQVREIASNLKPDLLTDSKFVNQGAPVINSNGVVLNGNGRAMAIQTAYEAGNESGKSYKKHIITNAQKYGVNVADLSGMQKPVLVRMVDDNADVSSIKNSTAGGARMAGAEQAIQDAKKIQLSTLRSYNDKVGITEAGNKTFLNMMLHNIATQEDMNTLIDSKGNVSIEGLKRIRNALFAAAYGEKNAKLIADMAENVDSNIRNISNALMEAAPRIARLQMGQDKGVFYPEYKLGDTFAKAAQNIMDMRTENKTFQQFKAEDETALFGSITGDGVMDTTEFFDDNKFSTKKMATMMNIAATKVMDLGRPDQQSLNFNDVTVDRPTTNEIIKEAIKDVANGGEINPFADTTKQKAEEPVEKKQKQPAEGKTAHSKAMKTVMSLLKKSGLNIVTDKKEMENALGTTADKAEAGQQIQKLILTYEEGEKAPDLTPVEKEIVPGSGKKMYSVAFVGNKPKGYIPKKIGKAYKLMEQWPDGSLHALFAGSQTSYKLGEWNWAQGYIPDNQGKDNVKDMRAIKSMKLAPRYGWHMGTGAPSTHHLMGVGDVFNPTMQYPSKGSAAGHPAGSKRVWVEVHYDATNDYTDIALQNPSNKDKDIRGLIPFGGYYMFQESNLSNWIIASSIKFHHVLSEDERQAILKKMGVNEELTWREKQLPKAVKNQITSLQTLLDRGYKKRKVKGEEVIDELTAEQKADIKNKLDRLNEILADNEKKLKELGAGNNTKGRKRTLAELNAERDRIRKEVFDNPEYQPIQYLQTRDGEVYGFVKDNTIYLDTDKMNTATPIHEYTHVWDNIVKQVNPELWKRGKELMRQTTIWDKVKNNPLYADIAKDEDLLASEVHAVLAGENGEAVLKQLEKDGEGKTLLTSLKKWLKDFWVQFKDTMSRWGSDEAQKINVDDFVKMPLSDMVKGVNLQGQLELLANKKATSESDKIDGREIIPPDGEVEVTGIEFGAYDEIGELRDKVKKYYKDNYQGKYVKSPLLGNVNLDSEKVHFTRSGLGKMGTTSGKVNKLLLIKYLPQLIKNADRVTSSPNVKDKRDAKQYTYLHSVAKINGHNEDVTISIFTDVNGNKYYNHILPNEEKEEGSPVPSVQATNSDGIPTISEPSSTSNIPQTEVENNQNQQARDKNNVFTNKPFGDRKSAEDNLLKVLGITPKKKEVAKEPEKKFIVSDEQLQADKNRLRKALNKISSTPWWDSDIMIPAFRIGVAYIERGARKFADFAKSMTDDFGDAIKPWLKSIWNAANSYDGGEIDEAKLSAALQYAGTIMQDNQNMTSDELFDSFEGLIGDNEQAKEYKSLLNAAYKGAEAYFNPSAKVVELNQEDNTAAEGGNENVNDVESTIPKRASGGNNKDRVGRDDESEESSRGERQSISQTGEESGNEHSDSVRDSSTTTGREASDSRIYGETSTIQDGRTRDSELNGSVRTSLEGSAVSDKRPAEDIVKSVGKRPVDAGKVNTEKPKVGSLEADIQKDLPMLLPAQQDDVVKAERRFNEAEETGMMFTNGTGTGKTFTGLGIIKRLVNKGKKNILIVVPSDQVAKQWREAAAEHFDIPIYELESVKDGGKGVTVTTYANFGQNNEIIKREWDMTVMDESHNLMQSEKGDMTASLKKLRALTYHKRGFWERAAGLYSDIRDKIDNLHDKRDAINRDKDISQEAKKTQSDKIDKQIEPLQKEWDEKYKQALEEWEKLDKANKPKVLFLSATPFSYVKNIEYAEGYLFNYPEVQNGGSYNSIHNGYEQFMIENFGYRLRYNKLTQPDAEVNNAVMERQFNENLKKSGALSGRTIDIDVDYDRGFLVTANKDSKVIGKEIDKAMDDLMGEKYRAYSQAIYKQFDGRKRNLLMEYLKVPSAINIAKMYIEQGKKVVVFHQSMKEGRLSNPFILDNTGLSTVRNVKEQAELKQQAEMFKREHPYLFSGVIENLLSPREAFRKAFGEEVGFFNGDIDAKRKVKGEGTDMNARQKDVQAFNDDSSNGKKVIVVQADAGNAGISLHDTTGKYPRVMLSIMIPKRPSYAIQMEGRIYRVGSKSNAIFRYLTTGTATERSLFADTVAGRASTAENLSMGENARTLRESFRDAYMETVDSDGWKKWIPGAKGEGTGGKEIDRSLDTGISEYDRAKTFYYSNQKKTSRNKAAEGVDYFATPEPLGYKMVQWADLKRGESVLEPSAGHGAIARFFPEDTKQTIIEPSNRLMTKAQMVTSDAKALKDYFENYNIVNKHNAIVMNPPFGKGGKTAVEHIAKAFKHLREGGRIVAIMPDGPAANKHWDKWYEGDEAKDAVLRKEILLPSVTFERAGTKVVCKVMIVDRIGEKTREANPDVSFPRRTELRDTDNINDFFDSLESVNAPERVKVASKNNESIKETNGISSTEESQTPQLSGVLKADTFTHTKTGEQIPSVEMVERLDKEVYKALNSLAKRHGGGYSRFAKRFMFGRNGEEARDAFLQEANALLNAQGIKLSADDIRYSSDNKPNGFTKLLNTLDFKSDDDLNSREQHIAELGKQLGVPVVFFEGNRNIHGFHSNGITFLNRNSATSLPWAFWHESFHWMKKNNPDLYNSLVGAVSGTDGFTAKQIEAYRQSIGRPELSNEDAIEEMLADKMPDVAKRVSFLKGLGKQNRSLTERIVSFIHKMMDKFKDFMHTPKAGLTTAQRDSMVRAFGALARDIKDSNGDNIFKVKDQGKTISLANGRSLPNTSRDTEDVKFSIDASDNSNESWLQRMKNRFIGTEEPTNDFRRMTKRMLEDLTQTKERWGKLNKNEESVYKATVGVIRTQKPYDWGAMLKHVGTAVAVQLEIPASDRMSNYIGRWIFDGAINDTSEESKVFQKAMKANAVTAERLKEVQQIFRIWNDRESAERHAGVIVFEKPKEGVKASTKKWLDSQYDKWIDELGPVKRLRDAIEKTKGIKLDDAHDIYHVFRLFRGFYGKAMTMIEGKSQKAVEALQRIFPNINFTGFKTVTMILDSVGALDDDDTRKDFSTYCVARHLLDIHEENNKVKARIADLQQQADELDEQMKSDKDKKLVNEYNAIKAEISELEQDIMDTPMTEEYCRKIIARDKDRFHDAQQDLVHYSNVLSSMLVDSGYISKERFQQLTGKWKNYVPMFRVFEENEEVDFGDSLKPMKGSNRQIIDPIQSIIRNTYDFVRRAEKNKAKLVLADLARTTGVGEFIEEVDNPGKPALGDVVTFYENGERKYLNVGKDVAEAINNVDMRNIGIAETLLAVPAKIARACFTVINPSFAIRNLMRDVADGMIYSKYGFKPWDIIKGFMHAFREDDMYYEWLASGAAQSSMVSLDRNYTQATVEKLTGGSKWSPMKVIELLQKVSEYSEAGTRIGVYERTKNRLAAEGGKSESAIIATAALESRDLMDFARGGRASRELNSLIPFFNASVQGFDKFFRTFDFRGIDKDKEKRKRVFRALTMLGITAVLPALVQVAMFGSDDWYKELPDWMKETHWILGRVGNTVIRIPKGQDLGIRMLSNFIEHGVQGDMTFKNQFAPIKNAAPDIMPIIIGPMFEATANYNFFTDAPVVPKRYENLPAEYQYDSRTSGLAKWLGEKLGYSPMKIDHIINGYGGNVSKFNLGVLDFIASDSHEINTHVEDMPILSGLTYMSYKNPESVTKYYEDLDKQQKYHTLYNQQREKHEDYDPGYYRRLNNANKKMQELAKQERAIIENPKISIDKKKDLQRAIQEKRVRLVQRVVKE